MKKLIAFLAALSLATPALAINDYTPTYSANITGITVPALATDLACFESAAGSTHRILRIDVNAHAPVTAVTASVRVELRSTLNTGGTSTVVVAGPYVSTNAASTATVRAYTAPPATTGTVVFVVDEADALLQPSAATTGGNIARFDFTLAQPLTLSGATAAVCLAVPATSGFIGSVLEVTFVYSQ
jgi:hypothetical protein